VILILVERAFATWLIGQAARLVTGEGCYVVTDKGLNIVLASGVAWAFPVLRGQDDAEAKAPCLIVYCQSAEQVEFFTQTHRVEVQITLLFPADESPDNTELLAKFEFAAQQLVSALYVDDLLQRVSELETGVTLTHQMSKWILESTWLGRNRVVRLRSQFHALPEDPPPP
jgi:hypothetical protein